MEKRTFTLIVCCFLFIGFLGCDSMTTTVQKAKDLQNNGRYGESIVMLETETAKRPNNREATYLLGLAYLNTGRFESAHSIFTTAVATKDDPENKERLKKEIARQYRDTFYRYLANVDPAERQKARLLLAAVPLYNSDPDLMDGIKKHLYKSGSQYVNKYALPRADEHFAYLHSLDKSYGALISEAYLSAFEAGEEADEEFNTVLVGRAISFSKAAKTQKIFSEYYFNLSQKAKNTESALEYLEIANRYGNLYASELASIKEQFEIEKMLELVKKNEAKYGKAQHVRVEKPGEIKKTTDIPKRTRIRYFSQSSFVIHLAPSRYVWNSAVSKIGIMKYTGDTDPVNVRFEMNSKPTDIYYWIEEL